MDNLKGFLVFVLSLLLTALFANILRKVIETSGVEMLLFVLAIMFGSLLLSQLMVELIFKGLRVVKESVTEIVQKRQEEKEVLRQVRLNEVLYADFKNQFKYFSDERLLELFQQSNENPNVSIIEKIALEEELVSRKLIEFSPTHEKIYFLRKKLNG